MGTRHGPHRHYRRSVDRAVVAVHRQRVLQEAARRKSFRWRAASRPSARLLTFEDYVVVIGTLSRAEREQLEMTHIEYGRAPTGGTVWLPKEVPDVA
jgi:hypothetical protein